MHVVGEAVRGLHQIRMSRVVGFARDERKEQTMSIRSERATTLLATALVADGAAFLTGTNAQIRIWSSPRAPRWYQRVMSFFAQHPVVCRSVAVVELLIGAGLLVRIGRR
jgi:hypothetical protein